VTAVTGPVVARLAAVRFTDVWLRYGRRDPWVLREVNIELGQAEVAVVLGRNGAGKSTLLAAAAGLLMPARGEVSGRPPTVGWVPERFPANQPFTLRGYLAAMARVRGLAGSEATDAIDCWARRLAFTEHLDTRLGRVSKGTAQKVGLSQALLRPPDLLVLDEPWEGLDAATREQVPAIIDSVLDRGGSVLVSDHLGQVARLPGARSWRIESGLVTRVPAAGLGPDEPATHYLVEVAIAAPELAPALAQLRAAGHEVVRVHPPRQPAAGR
jgi:ABC-2 type transport system ATP-binding protein